MIEEIEKLARGMAIVTYDPVDASDEIWMQLEQFLVEHMQLREMRDGVFAGSVQDDKSFHSAVKQISDMVQGAGEVFIWYYDDRGDFYRFRVG